MKIGVIRTVTPKDGESSNKHAQRIERVTGIPCVTRSIENQPDGIYDQESERIATPKIIDVAKKMTKEDDVSAIVPICAADPALAELREIVSVPVLGVGESGALVARSITNNVGVLAATEELPERMLHVLGHNVDHIRPEGVGDPSDLPHIEDIEEKSKAAVSRLLDRGAQVILFACTGYSIMGLGDLLREEMNINVVDSVEAAGTLAAYFIKRNPVVSN